jgi:CheY-like chemotaxis protein
MKALKSVLLIDDDKINNYINERLIRKTGFCNCIAIKNNGEEALLYLQNECIPQNEIPDLILLDINMPVINGIEFIEIFIQKHPQLLKKIKICVLSTSENESDLQKIKLLGDFYYVSKPLTSQKLMDIYTHNFNNSLA